MESKISDLTTKHDLVDLEERLIERLKEINSDQAPVKRWLRSKEIQQLLGLSSSGLQNLRVSGVIPYSRIQGSIYYNYDDITKVLEKNKVGIKN